MIRKVAIATGKPVAYVDTPEATVREGMLAAGINPEMVSSFMQYFSGVKAGKIHPPTTAGGRSPGPATKDLRCMAAGSQRGTLSSSVI